ncbi:flagellar assembly protein FliW [Bacillus sp. PS06]|uniref:flagellar assembly protein FliW n=1 Tax=Bacillus sp. PS06 TaxID=2764176 RepID=UPI0017816EE7|nr:flagellar assembly protein FliW [Bacillus sp. PS06]MBD8071398.1 flagellar assembly protein FliW [Bacillus sp. PS06]
MNIETKYHGQVTIEEKEIFTFEHGIPGFIDETSFVLLPFTEDSVFQILQSVKSPELGFALTNPFIFFTDYDIELPDHVVDELKIESEQDVAIYSILTLQDPFEKTTCNLQAPIVLNVTKRLGRQFILNDTVYTTRHQLVQEKVR